MPDLNKIYLYRMTHIDNIPYIIQYGITHHLSNSRNLDYKPIGDNSLINHRNSFKVPNGKMLGDYVPFYFGYRMPMLFVVQKGFNNVKVSTPENIVYLVSSVQKIIDLGLVFLFTDGHAVNGLTTFYGRQEIENIKSLLNFEAINAKYWNTENGLDFKRCKEAEFLVDGNISYNAVLGFFVYNTKAQLIVEKMNTGRKIVVKPDYYF
jgi:hypothetical protein